MTDTFSPRLDRAAGSATLIGRTVATNCVNAFAALRSAIETWEERKRFRLQLAEMMRATPHLIEDIGLTKAEAHAEIAKPIWCE